MLFINNWQLSSLLFSYFFSITTNILWFFKIKDFRYNLAYPNACGTEREQNNPPGGGVSSNMESPVYCDVCSKPYKNRATLYSHKNRDHGLKGHANIK